MFLAGRFADPTKRSWGKEMAMMRNSFWTVLVWTLASAIPIEGQVGDSATRRRNGGAGRIGAVGTGR